MTPLALSPTAESCTLSFYAQLYCLLLLEDLCGDQDFRDLGAGLFLGLGQLLIHSVLITLYVNPMVVFPLDKYHHIGARTYMWLTAASENLMVLP